MEEKPAAAAFKDLIATIRDIDHADFLAAVQASCGHDGIYASWQHEVETAIEPLKDMARHGDERAFKSLLYLGSKIVLILKEFGELASPISSGDIEDPFTSLIPDRDKNDSLRSTVTEENLEILASLPEEKRLTIIEALENEFPDVMTSFLPECLLKISQDSSRGLPVIFHDPENLSNDKFKSLERLTGKLAAIRAKAECARMVRRVMAHAEAWPVALFAIDELRSQQFKEFEMLGIGTKLPILAKPPQGRGRALGLTREGATAFALPVYLKLDEERNRSRSLDHLVDIRRTYEEYLNQSQGGGDDSSEIRMKLASSRPWNKSNEWLAMAALLNPFSADASVIDSWTQAGVKLIESESGCFSSYELLPDSLRKKASDSTDNPSIERIQAVIRDALKKGLESLAARIALADQSEE